MARSRGLGDVYKRQVEPRNVASNEARAGVTGLNCAGYGSSVCVTAPFGFIAAGLIIKALLAS
jgi:tRNA A37 threonylcarbamoyladenosine dehydratase